MPFWKLDHPRAYVHWFGCESSRNREIVFQIASIEMGVDRQLKSTAVKAFVKFQDTWRTMNVNRAAP